MRKWFFALALLALLTAPAAARAQGGPSLEILSVQLQPEEDRSSVLVIYDLKLADESPVPVRMEIPIPAEADLNAVALDEQGGLVVVPYEVVEKGDAQNIVFTASTTELFYRIEFYQPYEREGEHRHFVYQWDGRYAAAILRVDLKEPLDSRNVATDPPLNDISEDEYGFVYRAATFTALPAGSPLTIIVDYDKSSDILNVAGSSIRPSQTVDENTPGRISVETFMPWIIGSIGLVLAVVGLLYLARGDRLRQIRPRLRHHKRAEEGGDDQVYCHQCGQRARPGDRFCRSCGSRLRVEADD
jgi:hypothetical protein